jgi:hypothetical protein
MKSSTKLPLNGPPGTGQHSAIKYDVTTRNLMEFEASDNPVKELLERVNFMMSEVHTSVNTNMYKYVYIYTYLYICGHM